MSIFGNLDSKQQVVSVRRGAEAMIKQARKIAQGRPWSICELELADDDFDWLRRWASSFLAEQVRLNLHYDERLPGLGLLLLTLASETCRRDSGERAIYDVFYDVDWQPETRHRMFNPNGYPRNRVRQALEVACRTYGLRHAFDSPTVQPWYLTIKLQFGFTLAGAQDQLSHWLVGTQPDAIEWLLKGEPISRVKGTPIISESFQYLWKALLRYRATQTNHNLQILRTVLAQSPWVKPDWVETLVKASVRPVGGVVTVNSGSVNQSVKKETDDKLTEEVVEIVTMPRIVWNDGVVAYKAAYSPKLLTSLKDDCYFVTLDGKTVDVWRKNQEEAYGNLGGSLELALPLNRNSVLLSVTDSDGRGVCSQAISLSDFSSDFAAFSGNGRETSSSKLDTQYGYTLRLPSGSKFVPDEDLLTRYEESGSWWVQLQPGWSPDATLQLPGDPEGFPLLVHKDDEKKSHNFAERFQQYISVRVDGQAFHVQFQSVEQETDVTGLRIDGLSVDIHSLTPGVYISSRIAMSSIRHDGRIQVRVLVGKLKTRVLRFALTVPRDGLVVFDDSKWRNHPESEPLDSSKLSRTHCVIHPGPTHREEGWTLVEGSRHVRMRPGKPFRLSELGCRGWPLFISDHQFNFHAGARTVRLSESVVDHGVVSDGLQFAGSGLVCFHLFNAIDLSEDHHIVLWTKSGKLINFGHTDVRRDAQRWMVDPSELGIERDDPIVAGAIAFRGTRLGSWWSEDWWRPVTQMGSDDEAVATVAICLRWFGLPLIQRQNAIAAAAREYGGVFFEHWCQYHSDREFGPTAKLQEHRESDHWTADLLVQDEDEIGWFPTVRHLLRGWNPTGEEALQIAPRMFEHEGVDSIQGVVSMMSSSLPMIISKIVTQWIIAYPFMDQEEEFRSFITKPLCAPLVQRRKDFDARDQMLKHETHDAFHPHPELPWLPLSMKFINELSVADPENFEAVHNHSDLCRYLAAKLIYNSANQECQHNIS